MLDRMLTITYVTDPDLDMTAQQRVIREFIASAGEMPLRVAFRLPGASDIDIRALISWYLELEDANRLLPALIHGRYDLAGEFPGCVSWIPSAALRREDVRASAYSVHDHHEARLAGDRGAVEVIYGHVFVSESHPGEPPRGLTTLAAIADSALLVTAIGGINEETIGALRPTGIDRVAMIRAVSRSPDIPTTLRRIHERWSTG
ncbi:MAG: thiamine phosphate synthase [Thermomicrobiales bacterium]|nr:thiamine phosphate synthase [Thermomicrobiales bacterium]MCO5217277.1 thiamine phosphate synthase [Thermomicrobiales bacterium]MCO5225011.1 thiamine phosphate synthase [Thermomicrobiales bacterium]MCO5227888.1 thiamine phosphate synthase [Thermomicrobiales bacterium]